MTRISLVLATVALAACGKPLETKEEFASAIAGASVATTASRGGMIGIFESGSTPQPLPVPSITVKGAQSGEATLSINPVGAVVGLIGQGILFDVEYADYSVDGINHLHGDLSVLANFDYLAALGENPAANFEVSFVGSLGLTGVVRDDARVNLRIRTNLAELTTRSDQLTLRLKGSVHASQTDLEFLDEDVVINWSEVASR